MKLSTEPFAIPMVLVGAVLIVALLLQAGLRRTPVPAVVAHLGLGFALAVADARGGWLDASGHGVVEFLGRMGLVLLLFRIGLESNVYKLLENLRSASLIWIANMSASGLAGFAAALGLGFDLVPSLFVGVALSATSVGVGAAVWREESALDSRSGQLFLDVAELDDISGIVLMAVLIAVAPLLRDGDTGALAISVGRTAADVLARLALFALAVALFARFLEAPLSHLVSRLEPVPDRMISVVSVGLIVAAVAGALGFSLAIGAFFGGLAFSRDPEAVRLDAYLDSLYDFFTPFFFISIGLHVAPQGLGDALPLGVLLFGVAVAGKLVGAAPALIALPPRGASLLGLSLVPRAEIALVIAQYGTLLGAWAMPERLFSAIVIASLLTCLAAPIAIRGGLRRGVEPGGSVRE